MCRAFVQSLANTPTASYATTACACSIRIIKPACWRPAVFKGLSSLGHWASSFDELGHTKTSLVSKHICVTFFTATSVASGGQRRSSPFIRESGTSFVTLGFCLPLSLLDLKKGEAMRSPSFVFKKGESFESFIWR